MLKKFRTVFTLLLIFGLSAVLMGDESKTVDYDFNHSQKP